MERKGTNGCTGYKKNVTVTIHPQTGDANPDPICVAANGTVKWVCSKAWGVEFDNNAKPVDGKGRFGGGPGVEGGGAVTASEGDEFKYTVVVQTEDGEKRIDPDMVVGPPKRG